MGNLREKLTPATIVILAISIIACVAAIVGLFMDIVTFSLGGESESYTLSDLSNSIGIENSVTVTKALAYATVILSAVVLILYVLYLFSDSGVFYIFLVLLDVILAIAGVLVVAYVWAFFGGDANFDYAQFYSPAIGAWLLGVGGVIAAFATATGAGRIHKNNK